nr:MAG TPA: tail-needle protein [Caudoviricetes sp.]
MANEKEWQQDISTTVDAHTADLANHENRLNQAELNIADHEKRIDNIETTSDVGQFATRIQAVEEKNTEQDSAIDTLKKNVSDNLQTAKQYTETKLADYATKTENSNTLEQAKQYANSKADDTLNQAKTDASQKYLPLTGGNLSGDVWGNRPPALSEQNIGLRDPVSGAIYIYSNNHARGIFINNTNNSNAPIATVSNSGDIVLYANIIKLNDNNITIG